MVDSLGSENSINSKEIYDFSVKQLLFLFWDARLFVLAMLLLSSSGSFFYAVSLPDIYRSEAVLAPKVGGNEGTSGLSALSGQFGSLVNMAGLNLNMGGSATAAVVALETLETFRFFENHMYEKVVFNMHAVEKWDKKGEPLSYKNDVYDIQTDTWRVLEDGVTLKPSVQAAYSKFNNIINVYEDIQTGFVSVSIDHESPVIAQEWLQLVITSINEDSRSLAMIEAENAIEYLSKQRETNRLLNLDGVFSRLIEEQTKNLMLASIKEEYVFQVIEPPIVPENKRSPQRLWILIFGTTVGFLLSIFFVLMFQGVRILIDREFFRR